MYLFMEFEFSLKSVKVIYTININHRISTTYKFYKFPLSLDRWLYVSLSFVTRTRRPDRERKMSLN